MNALIDEIDLKWSFKNTFWTIKNGNRISKVLPKDMYGHQEIDLSWDDFISTVKRILTIEKSWNFRIIINSISKDFFLNWNKGANFHTENTNYIINHMSMMCFADPSFFLNAYPDGYILQTIREPKAWLASMKTHFKVKAKEDSMRFLKFSLHLWYEATIRAIINANCFSAQYFLLRYEDLVSNTQKTMEKIASKINLKIEPVLFKPTMGHKPWFGNSCYGAKSTVDNSSLQEWKKFLTHKELDYIDRYCSEIIKILGYGEKMLLPIRKDISKIYSDELFMNINFLYKNDSQRVYEENRRMASMIFNLHRDLVVENRQKNNKTNIAKKLSGIISSILRK